MSEDASSANDGAGIWRDPGGIVTLAEQTDNYVSLDHGITVICDSHRTLIARLAVLHKKDRRRIPCPECGRMATLYVRKGAAHVRLQVRVQRDTQPFLRGRAARRRHRQGACGGLPVRPRARPVPPGPRLPPHVHARLRRRIQRRRPPQVHRKMQAMSTESAISNRSKWLAHLRYCTQCPTNPCDRGEELIAAVEDGMAPGEFWQGIWRNPDRLERPQ